MTSGREGSKRVSQEDFAGRRKGRVPEREGERARWGAVGFEIGDNGGADGATGQALMGPRRKLAFSLNELGRY